MKRLEEEGRRLSFSVVINTWNRASFLRTTLSALKQLRHPLFEVVVVNGPSTDATEAVLSEYADVVRIGVCPVANLAVSRNIGIAMARGDIVCFLDDDAVPEPDWLDQLELQYRDEGVGAVGGFIRDHTGVEFQCRFTTCDLFGDARQHGSLGEAEEHLNTDPDSYLTQTGANSSFRRDVLLKIGGFDEIYAYFLDETDVVIRMLRAGYSLVVTPDAEVHHKFAPSNLRNVDRTPKSLYLPARSKTYFMIKTAWGRYSFDRVVSEVGAYRAEARRHNRWRLREAIVDEEHFRVLEDDVQRGVEDGLAHALQPRRLLSEETRSAFADQQFKRFCTPSAAGRRLRVVLTSQDYPPGNVGGIGLWTHQMAVGLAARGHEVSVITRSEGQHTVDFEDGVWVHRIPGGAPRNQTYPALPDLPGSIASYSKAILAEVRRINERRGVDVVSAPIWDLEGIACIADGGIPTITSLHTTYALALPYKQDWLRDASFRRTHVNRVIAGERWLLERSNWIMSNTSAAARDILEACQAKVAPSAVRIVPHGLGDSASDLRDARSRSDSAVTILFVGRFEQRKGIDVLLKALPDALAKHARVRAVLIGDSSLTPGGVNYWRDFLLRHRDAEWMSRIFAPGTVDRSTLMQAYRDCDVFVAPSKYESFGLVYLEAMMFGKPCIACEAGGAPEVVQDGVNGLLTKPGDAAALASAIEALIVDASLRERLGRAGRELFTSKYTLAHMLDAAGAVYWEAASVRSDRRAVHASFAG